MNVKEKVNEWIDNNQNEVIELLQELIRKPSVNAYFDEEEQEWCEWYDDNGLDIKEHFEESEEN